MKFPLVAVTGVHAEAAIADAIAALQKRMRNFLLLLNMFICPENSFSKTCCQLYRTLLSK